jgi:hypothetical protein
MFKAFPKIGQFANAIKFMRLTGKTNIKYRGTVKLHGTNSAVTYDLRDGTVRYQSRNRELTLTDDNAGFCAWASQHEEEFKAILQTYATSDQPFVAIYGEWCGGSIQSNVAINQLDKRFVAFAICTVDTTDDQNRTWHPMFETIATIDGTDTIITLHEITVDVDSTEETQDHLDHFVTLVEAECPYGKANGVTGVGEGIVWVAYDENDNIMCSEYWFKTKGEKHSKSKVKVAKIVDTTLLVPHQEFTEAVVTEGRLEQGWAYLAEMNHPQDRSSTSHFLRWFIGDVMAEEADLMEEKQVTQKDMNKLVATPARNWLFARIDSL